MIFFSHDEFEVMWWGDDKLVGKNIIFYSWERFVIIIFRNENVEESEHGHLPRFDVCVTVLSEKESITGTEVVQLTSPVPSSGSRGAQTPLLTNFV